ncbi:MobF family relaxase [Actinomarinicola tropica]|uniref:MobF family relaxase n=1 Tax=Actinomarinicola tropica TaxID=2789776 RepID=UPI00189B42F7|nr:MobF family relaxase [Actinomarinicola tropica]
MTTLKASTAAGLGGLLAYYAGLAEDRQRPGLGRGPVDYYLDPNEPPGRWGGGGLAGLGVSGEVTGEQLRAILEGYHPVTNEQLGRAFGDSSARGFDATFSAPKSVSALWALSPDPWIRAEVLAAHDAAVDAALGWFERHGAVTRRGRDGVLQVDTRGIAVATFRQHTSRAMDPQLHTHAVIVAKVQDPAGKWLSLDARFLKYQQRTIGWIYDAALRAELTRRLAIGWEPTADGPSDMTCVPASVRDLLSQRSGQVADKLDELIRRWSTEHDGADPDPRTIATLERTAAVASRPAKANGTDAAALHDTWRHQARTVGFDPDQLRFDLLPGPEPARRLSDDQLVDEALRRVVDEQSTWLGADVARHLSLIIPPDGGRAADVTGRIDALAARAMDRCVELGPDRTRGPRRKDGRAVREHVTDRRLTTTDVLDQETRLQQWATHGTGHVPSAPGLDAQERAAAAIAGDDRLVLVVGPAGAGKTSATAYAVRRLRAEGRPVVGLAPSGKAADVLRTEAGCPTDTLAGFHTRHSHGQPSVWPTGTTVIVDEAGMARTDDLAQLVDLAERHRWRLVAVGDPAQLPAVGRGGVFAHWCNTLPHHSLDTPRRFTEEWEADASLALRDGDPRAAEAYAAHRRLDTIHPALVAAAVADVHQAQVNRGRTVAVTTNTADMARALNTEIQRRLDRHDPHRHRSARRTLADGTCVVVGDTVATRRNDPALLTDRGEQVRNRHTWTVTALTADGALTVAHPDRGTVTLPAGYVEGHVELGWAVTGYGNQGDTVDIGLAVLEPGTTRNHAYVALTRGRHDNSAWITDPTGTLDPADALTTMIERTPHGDSALALRRQLHRAARREAPELEDVLLERTPSRQDQRTPTAAAPDVTGQLDERVAAMRARLDQLQGEAQRETPGLDRGLRR